MVHALEIANEVEMPSSDVDGLNADLYASDLPLSLASGLASLQATTHPTSVNGPTEIELASSPCFAKPVSWHAIDAAITERKANMQQDIAAQELRAAKRCLDLRESITRTAQAKIFDPDPLVVPRSWPISGTPIRMLVEHPTLFQEYLEGERFSRVAIKIRREYLETEDCVSPEIRRLAAMEADFRNTQSSRALVDLLLEAIQHVTQKLVLEITEGEKTTKRPVSKLCRRLLAHSTHTNGELIQAVEAINDMEREHMPWRYNALDGSKNTSPISDIPSAIPPLDSPPADDICLSPEPISSPTPNETSPSKDPRRLRVKFQENLPSRSSGKWRIPRKSQSNPSRKPLSSQSLPRGQRAVQMRGRSHYRDTDISHLTHPIVMMEFSKGYWYNGHWYEHSQPRQSSSSEARPTDLNPAPGLIIHPAASRPASTRPEATLSPESSLANTGKKRQASEELPVTSDCETKPAKRPNRSERDGNAHSEQVESRDANLEEGVSMFHTSPSARHPANHSNRQHSAIGVSYT
ncbi:hypothetical protein BKA58DRAFT_458542 [Alternaria rosae]|uniref:uncharacterized protein n=1 Tax=Alternaria rosae TaxID=1187941 RepID=UPI001E8EB97E|nr:uncharacterized protein BKA58DRAFT_458542 [Alternaria rosae]KAH6867960.1 hypothetical protein BKA58DRAFT_458542 [Alternaria rosae]